MLYLKCGYVDSVTQIPVSLDTPARNGTDLPRVEGIEFAFALESEYPTLVPTLFCTAADDADVAIPGVIETISEGAFADARDAEMDARVSIRKERSIDAIAARRYRAETAGFIWEGVFIDTQRDSQAKINSSWSAARSGLRTDTDVWKCGDPATGQVLARVTTNAEMIQIGEAAYRYIQACYNREAELQAAVADGSITAEMLEQGWPA